VNVPDPVSAWLGFKILQVSWFTELHTARDHMNREFREPVFFWTSLNQEKQFNDILTYSRTFSRLLKVLSNESRGGPKVALIDLSFEVV
jgi:hypothetical protein